MCYTYQAWFGQTPRLLEDFFSLRGNLEGAFPQYLPYCAAAGTTGDHEKRLLSVASEGVTKFFRVLNRVHVKACERSLRVRL